MGETAIRKYAHDNGPRDDAKLCSNGGNFLGSEGHVMRSSEKLCWWFINGRKCPYGEDCIFSHSNAGEAKEMLPMHQENVAITLMDDTQAVVNRRKSDSRGFQNLNYDADQIQQKKLPWKTRLCCNWEKTGICRYGAKCNFAHGEAEQQKLSPLRLRESGKTFSGETRANAAKVPVSGKRGYRIAYEQLENGKKRLIWWDNVKQMDISHPKWQKTLRKVLDCIQVYNFNMDEDGTVTVSGRSNPYVLLNTIGKAGKRAEVIWLQSGECSNCLNMPSTAVPSPPADDYYYEDDSYADDYYPRRDNPHADDYYYPCRYEPYYAYGDYHGRGIGNRGGYGYEFGNRGGYGYGGGWGGYGGCPQPSYGPLEEWAHRFHPFLSTSPGW